MRTTMAAPATSVRSTDVRVFVLVGIEGLLERGVGDARAGKRATLRPIRPPHRGGSSGTRDEWPTLNS